MDLPREFGVTAAGVALTFEFRGYEEETPRESPPECRSIYIDEGAGLPANLVVRHLEEDFDGAEPIPEGGLFGSPRPALGQKGTEEGVDGGIDRRGATVAPVAEFRQQRDG